MLSNLLDKQKMFADLKKCVFLIQNLKQTNIRSPYLYLSYKIKVRAVQKQRMESKINNFSNINGSFRRYFGRNMSQDFQLRLSDGSKTCMMFGSDM
jgi:hypothetical protein